MVREIKECLASQEKVQEELSLLRDDMDKHVSNLAEAKRQQRELRGLDVSSRGDNHTDALSALQAEINELVQIMASDQHVLAAYEMQLSLLSDEIATYGGSTSTPAPPTSVTSNPVAKVNAKLTPVPGLPKLVPDVTDLQEFFELTSTLLASSKIPIAEWPNYLPGQSVDHPALVIWLGKNVVVPGQPAKSWAEVQKILYGRFNKGQDCRRNPRSKYTELTQKPGQSNQSFFADLAMKAADAQINLSDWFVLDDIKTKKMLPAWRSLLKLTDPRFEDYNFNELFERVVNLDDAKVDPGPLGLLLSPPAAKVPKTTDPKDSQIKCTFPGCGSTQHKKYECPRYIALLCEGCGKNGHLLADCRRAVKSVYAPATSGKTSADLSKVKCAKCGSMGHYANNCTTMATPPPVVRDRQPPMVRSFLSFPDEPSIGVPVPTDENEEIREANLAIRGDDGNYVFRAF